MVLYSFCADSYCTDGGSRAQNRIAGLIRDAAGNLYGMTPLGGAHGDCYGYAYGTVFELTPGRGQDRVDA
jgi:hypothetical protein